MSVINETVPINLRARKNCNLVFFHLEARKYTWKNIVLTFYVASVQLLHLVYSIGSVT